MQVGDIIPVEMADGSIVYGKITAIRLKDGETLYNVLVQRPNPDHFDSILRDYGGEG
jgi:hypothetical protein